MEKIGIFIIASSLLLMLFAFITYRYNEKTIKDNPGDIKLTDKEKSFCYKARRQYPNMVMSILNTTNEINFKFTRENDQVLVIMELKYCGSPLVVTFYSKGEIKVVYDVNKSNEGEILLKLKNAIEFNGYKKQLMLISIYICY